MNTLHAENASKNNRAYSAASKRLMQKIPCDGCVWAPIDSAVRSVLLFLDALTTRWPFM